MADIAKITLKGESEAKNFIDEALRGDIAYEELSTTVSKTGGYVAGDHLIYLGQYYEVVADIAQGGTIVTSGAGQNVEEREVGDEIKKNKTQVLGVICDVETSPATAAHSAGDQFYYDGALVEATSAIAIGDTIVVSPDTGYNVKVADKVVAQIQTLTSAFVNNVNVNGSKNLCPYEDTLSVPTTNTAGQLLASVKLKAGDKITFVCTQDNAMTSNVRNTLIIDNPSGVRSVQSAATNNHLSAGLHVMEYTATESGVHKFGIWANTISTATTYSKFMICHTDVYNLDPTYVPYAKSNQQLTKDTTGLIDNQKVNGAVNMLPNTNATQVKYGITYTVNPDGTITADGKATNVNGLYQNITLPKGTYKLSGCPSGGSQNTYYIGIVSLNIYDYGDGAIFTLSQETTMEVSIARINNTDTTYSDLTFKPMITVPSYNGDYVPYAKTNKELTDDGPTVKTINVTAESGVGFSSSTAFKQCGKNVILNFHTALSIAANTEVLLFTLPEGSRPSTRLVFPAFNSNSDVIVGFIIIKANGEVSIASTQATTAGAYYGGIAQFFAS
jgi:hypothetical protein